MDIDHDEYPSDQFPVMNDGLLLPVVDDESPLLCRNPEQFGDGTAVSIRQSKVVKWYLDGHVPFLTRDELRTEIAAAIALWSAVADVSGEEVSSLSEANLIITCVQMDGPGGVLADATLPNPSVRVQRMRLDIAEGALKRKIRAILCHEFGHIFGLQHFPDGPPPELMEASLKGIEAPQPTEAALMAKWYGPPVSIAPTPPAPPGVLVCTTRLEPFGDRINCTIDAQMGDKKAQLKGSKAW